MPGYKRILAALDGGETREAVASRAIELAGGTGAEVMLVHVIESIDLEQACGDLDEIAARGKEALAEDLSGLLGQAGGKCRAEVVAKVGRIDEMLAQAVSEFSPDLVVCGTRGLSAVRYALVGSTSS